MTHVSIEPGICGYVCDVQAEAVGELGEQEVTVCVSTGCKNINGMLAEAGSVYDPFDVCLRANGPSVLDIARENYPVHAACPVIAGIVKAVEAECGLALKKDCHIRFLDD